MFKKGFILASWLCAKLTFASVFVEGTDYIRLPGSSPASTSKPAQIVEFFSYGCPWCYRLEPGLQHWLASVGKHVQFSRTPVVFNKNWEYYAKAFYTAQALGELSRLSPLLFKAILVDKLPLNSNQAMVNFFSQHGVDKKMAESAFFNSASIELQVKKGQHLMAEYQIDGVPAFVVNQRYKTDLKMAKEEGRLLNILKYLLEKQG